MTRELAIQENVDDRLSNAVPHPLVLVGFCLFDVNPLEEISFTRKIFLNNLPWNVSKRTPFSNYVSNAMGCSENE